MPTGSISGSILIGGISMPLALVRTQDGQIGHVANAAYGYAGTVTSGGGTTGGTLTVSGANGIYTAADFIDVYWAGAGNSVYGGDISDVTGDVITVSGFDGNLPANTTAITVSIRSVIDTDFDGNDVGMVAAYSAARGLVVFLDTGSLEVFKHELVAGEPWFYASGNGWTNPLASDIIGSVVVSTSHVSANQDILLGVAYDSVD